MSKLLSASFLLGLLMSFPVVSRAADQPADPAKDKDIRTLLEVSGAGKMGQQMFEAVAGQMKRIHPEVPQDFWVQIAKEIDFKTLIDQMVPIYASHFSDEEIKDLIRFYQSPVGRKLVQEQPAMMQESMQVGQKWGYELGAKVAKRMQDQGYLKKS